MPILFFVNTADYLFIIRKGIRQIINHKNKVLINKYLIIYCFINNPFYRLIFPFFGNFWVEVETEIKVDIEFQIDYFNLKMK
jgi:hypothetical protein